jgi:hypothetical protein
MLKKLHQYKDGRDEPPNKDVFIDAIVWCPSPPPQANRRNTWGKPPALKVNPVA